MRNYRVYYIGNKGREIFIKETDYKGYENLFQKYDGNNGLRVFRFGIYILIVSPRNVFLMNQTS